MDGFWMGMYEVTNRQYRKFKPSHSSKYYKSVSLNGDDQPVVYVSWNDAKAFILWLNVKTGKAFSLPTEAQWEYACRAGTGTIRYWGGGDGENAVCTYANVYDLTSKRVNERFSWGYFNCDDGYSATSPVGRFKSNNFGLYDMLGNVWEWCEDGYDKDAYLKHGRNNPLITNRSGRVLRGGSWNNESMIVRCAYCSSFDPSLADDFFWFRLVLSGHK
nr:formylglycine-generating enzyme family protein [uncultured Desulfobacter sp.]